MARANKERMEYLHNKLCEGLIEALEKGVYDPRSESYIKAPASYFAAAIAFLDKNDIKGILVEGSAHSKLMQSLGLGNVMADIRKELAGKVVQ